MAAVTAAVAQGGEPVEVGLARQLFFDQSLIEYREGVDLVLHPGESPPGGPVLRAEMPWEAQGVLMGGSVIAEPGDGLLRMWYTARAETDRVCYAVSSDGLRWRRPAAGPGQPAEHGPESNIVVDRAGYPAVLRDEADPDPAGRYKMLCRPALAAGQCRALTSPDGVHWRPAGRLHVPGNGPVSLVRSGVGRLVAIAAADGRVWLLAGPDFTSWTAPEPLEITANPAGMGLWCSGAATIGFPWWPGPPGHASMLASRDLRKWRDPGFDEPLLAAAVTDSLSGLAAGPVECGGRLFLYYSSTTDGADAVKLMSWRQDGPVSARGGHQPGTLLTKRLVVAGDRLLLNALAPGGVRVQLENDRGQALAGFSGQECLPFSGDTLAHEVSWEGGASLEKLRGHSVRLRFTLYEADLFSFRFAVPAGAVEEG